MRPWLLSRVGYPNYCTRALSPIGKEFESVNIFLLALCKKPPYTDFAHGVGNGYFTCYVMAKASLRFRLFLGTVERMA